MDLQEKRDRECPRMYAVTASDTTRIFVPLGCAPGVVDDQVRRHLCHVNLLV
jgi:hypothetical protein